MPLAPKGNYPQRVPAAFSLTGCCRTKNSTSPSQKLTVSQPEFPDGIQQIFPYLKNIKHCSLAGLKIAEKIAGNSDFGSFNTFTC